MTADHVLESSVILSDGSTAALPVEAATPGQYQGRAGLEGERRRVAGLPRLRPRLSAYTPYHWRRSGGYNPDRF
ncbi:MAG: hypothetical protein U0401_03345 [Anaerolineae bacterium]